MIRPLLWGGKAAVLKMWCHVVSAVQYKHNENSSGKCPGPRSLDFFVVEMWHPRTKQLDTYALDLFIFCFTDLKAKPDQSNLLPFQLNNIFPWFWPPLSGLLLFKHALSIKYFKEQALHALAPSFFIKLLHPNSNSVLILVHLHQCVGWVQYFTCRPIPNAKDDFVGNRLDSQPTQSSQIISDISTGFTLSIEWLKEWIYVHPLLWFEHDIHQRCVSCSLWLYHHSMFHSPEQILC